MALSAEQYFLDTFVQQFCKSTYSVPVLYQLYIKESKGINSSASAFPPILVLWIWIRVLNSELRIGIQIITYYLG
jgi:hypothetical protein